LVRGPRRQGPSLALPPRHRRGASYFGA
jgi:hypothetical protein